MRLSRPAEALNDANRACALDPMYDKAQYRRGQALQALGYLEDAVEQYTTLLDLKPKLQEVGNVGKG